VLREGQIVQRLEGDQLAQPEVFEKLIEAAF
jgi:hypothetical protein